MAADGTFFNRHKSGSQSVKLVHFSSAVYTGASRKTQGSNMRWTITVQPDGDGDVTIALPATTNCSADGAVCTEDGRMLSNASAITVPGPDAGAATAPYQRIRCLHSA